VPLDLAPFSVICDTLVSRASQAAAAGANNTQQRPHCTMNALKTKTASASNVLVRQLTDGLEQHN
jgi:hypothetical protein